MSILEFTKMHGLGNDFIVFDGREQLPALSEQSIRALSDRYIGIGCDQLIMLEPGVQTGADVFMRIYNQDGSQSGACGNATRCIGGVIMKELDQQSAVVETIAGLLQVEAKPNNQVSVDMGPVNIEWQDIPLSLAMDTLHLPIEAGGVSDPCAINVGNPHMVFFVDDANATPLDQVGHDLEHHELFPERTNVQMAEILSSDRIRLKTWERGVGRTHASGSSACATLAAAHRRGLAGRSAEIIMDGGTLQITWRDDNHITQTGPASISYTGLVDPDLLEST